MKIKFIAALALLAVAVVATATGFCGCSEKNGDENDGKKVQNVADYAENRNGTEGEVLGNSENAESWGEAENSENSENAEKNENAENSESSKESEKSENEEEYVLYKETEEESETEIVYGYNERGDCVCITEYSPQTQLRQTVFTADFIYETLENGNKAVFIKSRRNGEAEREQYKEYSSDGKILFFRDKEPSMFEDCGGYCEYTYEYDSNGRLSAKNTFLIFESDENRNSQTSERFEYDENGNMKKETKFDVNGNAAGFTLYEYDERGNETRRTEYTPDGEEDSESYITERKYVYDEENRIVSQKELNVIPGGGGFYVASNVELEYDEAGRLRFEYDRKYGKVCEYKPLSQCIVKFAENG